MGKCIVCGYETERKFDFPHGKLFLCGYLCEGTLDFKLNKAVTAVSISLDDIINREPFGEPSPAKLVKIKGEKKLVHVIKTYGDKIYQFLNKDENKELLMETLSHIADGYCNDGYCNDISETIGNAIESESAEIEVAYINSLTMDELLCLKESEIVNDEARETLETRLRNGE